MICGIYILQQLYTAMIGAGIFYATWVLKNKNLFGVFFMGSKHSFDYRLDIHTHIGREMEWNV